jgi:PEP-CTERM motif
MYVRPFRAWRAAMTLALALAATTGARAGVVMSEMAATDAPMTTQGVLGRFEFALPQGATLTTATLELEALDFLSIGQAVLTLDGVDVLTVANASGQTLQVDIADLSLFGDGRAELAWRVSVPGPGCQCLRLEGGARLQLAYDEPATGVPEPASLALVGLGLLGLRATQGRRASR